jgi:hypothetical protein
MGDRSNPPENIDDQAREVPPSVPSDGTASITALAGGATGAVGLGAASAFGAMTGLPGGPLGVVAGATTGFILGAATGGAMGAATDSVVSQEDGDHTANQQEDRHGDCGSGRDSR